MTDTSTTPSDDQTPTEERSAIEELREMGISIVLEESRHRVGNMTRYLVVGKYGVEDSDPTVEALGDTRLNALRALKVQALAS